MTETTRQCGLDVSPIGYGYRVLTAIYGGVTSEDEAHGALDEVLDFGITGEGVDPETEQIFTGSRRPKTCYADWARTKNTEASHSHPGMIKIR